MWPPRRSWSGSGRQRSAGRRRRRRWRRRASAAARSYLHAWLPRPRCPEPLTRRVTSLTPLRPAAQSKGELAPDGGPGHADFVTVLGGRGAPLAPESACFACAKCALPRSLWPARAQLRCTPRLGAMGGWECLREFGKLYWQSGAGVVVLENGGGAGPARCLSAGVRPCAKQGGWWGSDNV